jgi:light-regulated signal transduction histidine kinase (bacteriophytochrome)
LRAINGFAELLRAKYDPQLPEEARGFIARIQGGATRMGALIDDLLQFSRIARGELVRRPVALGPLVREIVDDLETEARGTEVEWRIGELGTASGDPGLLRQVFANLLQNASKFSRDQDKAVIEVGREDQGGEAVFFVRDNGVGFDMHDADHIFEMFQRLHRQEDFEGTGIGLAIVERIVARHGGRVWAEATPGRGATFFFTLSTTEPGRDLQPVE